ncbi:MAG: hypothetical protein FWG06_00055 [Clostridiales bacterium]|nr:hypothetical protein [Clostridiales bacterium]
MGLEKARIIIENEKKDQEQGANKEQKKNVRIDVMYNPASLKIKSGAKYSDPKETNTKEKELQQFLGGVNEILSVELFFDTTREGINARDVRTVVMPILNLVKIPKGGKNPPKLVFAWGGFNFPCVISSIDHTYDYFNSAGQALRATLAITFLGRGQEDKPPEEEKPAADTQTKEAKIKDGERPPEAAERLTGDQKEWRPVYEQKEIDNPLDNNEAAGK